jgi:hypothetical protein
MILKRQGRHARRRSSRLFTLNLFRLRPLVVALLVGTAVLLVAPSSGIFESASSAQTPPPVCPGGVSQCVSITMPCGSATCPVVTAGPTLNIGENEYVYLSMQNFTVGDDARVALCPVAEVLVVGTNPSCAIGTDPESVSLTQISVPADPDGTLAASFPTAFDPSNQGNVPITASRLISTLPADPAVSSFFCDNSPDYCALFVQEYPANNFATPLSASDTVVVPLSFAPQTSGCPSSDPLIQSDSAFSVEHFMPAAVDSTCTEKGGVAALDTSTNTGEILSDFDTGGTPIAFTDAAQDPSETAGLKAGSYRFVPIAVSATVVGYLGGDETGSAAYPIASYNLTPNMVAGVLTANYLQPYGSDVIMPPLNCKKIYGCEPGQENNYTTFSYLNPAPAGAVGPTTYGTFFSSVDTGASYQVTNWVCSAPNAPFTVTVPLIKHGKPVPKPVQVLDTHTAPVTLTTPVVGAVWPPLNDPTAAWPYPKCQPYETLPTLSASSNQYSFSETEDLQATALRNFAYLDGQPRTSSSGQTYVGFGGMDWSEASYFGLNSANLQNAAGDFVGPSQASIDAALSDASTLPDGVLSYNYDDTNPAAYPMPLVTYALVSTTPQPAAQSQAEGDLLTNLACYSRFGGSIALPTGYVPLPNNLYEQAMSEISQTFPYTKSSCNGSPPALPPTKRASPPPPSHPGGKTKPHTGTTTSSQPSSATRPLTASKPVAAVTVASGVGRPSTKPNTHKTPLPSRSPSSSPSPSPSPSPLRNLEPVIAALAEGAERWIVAGLASAALLALLVGPLVVLAPRVRRRLAKGHNSS